MRGNAKFIIGIVVGIAIGGGIMYYLQDSGAFVSDFIPKVDTKILETRNDYSQFIGQSVTANQFSFEIVDIKEHEVGPKGDSGKYFEYLEIILKIENHGERALAPDYTRYYVKDSNDNMYPGEYFSARKAVQPGIPEEMSFYFRIPIDETLTFELLVPVVGKSESLATVGRVI